MAAPDPNSEDEWEVINDDGFVYKCKRRLLEPTQLTRPSYLPDPGLEQKFKTKRKLNALLNIKTKYLKEFQLWEDLVHQLNDLEQNVQLNNNIDKGLLVEGERRDSGINQGSDLGLDNRRKIGSFWIDDILSQVEAQLAVIHTLSNLCDVAEALCDAHEEKSKESFFDLPIWGSSRELMASLCED